MSGGKVGPKGGDGKIGIIIKPPLIYWGGVGVKVGVGVGEGVSVEVGVGVGVKVRVGVGVGVGVGVSPGITTSIIKF